MLARLRTGNLPKFYSNRLKKNLDPVAFDPKQSKPQPSNISTAQVVVPPSMKTSQLPMSAAAPTHPQRTRNSIANQSAQARGVPQDEYVGSCEHGKFNGAKRPDGNYGVDGANGLGTSIRNMVSTHNQSGNMDPPAQPAPSQRERQHTPVVLSGTRNPPVYTAPSVTNQQKFQQIQKPNLSVPPSPQRQNYFGHSTSTMPHPNHMKQLNKDNLTGNLSTIPQKSSLSASLHSSGSVGVGCDGGAQVIGVKRHAEIWEDRVYTNNEIEGDAYGNGSEVKKIRADGV